MAIWQCDFHLVLDSWLKTTGREQLALLPEEVMEEEPWWQAASLLPNYSEQLAQFAPRTKSWSADIEIYGEEEGNCLKVSHDEERVVSVWVRIDLRQLDRSFIDGVLSFARSQQCHLVNIEGRLIAPELDSLRIALKDSRAYRFVANPQKYLEELKENPIQDSSL